MKDSNLNLKISNVDSQIVGSSCSLSLPSEPPDIRKWFPIYTYESPALGTSDNFEDSVYKESECEKDRLVGEKSNGGKENFGNCTANGNSLVRDEDVSQVADSSCSLSQPSEPPDVGKWFSGYVYESPELGTCFRDSHFKERECEEDGFVIEESNTEQQENLGKFRKTMKREEEEEEEEKNLGNFRRNRKREEDIFSDEINSNGFVKCHNSFQDNKLENQSLSKVADSSSQLSLPSEPPDLGIWFSSYAYKSPLLDTDFQDSHFKERECMKDEFVNEESNKEKEENSGKFRKTRNKEEDEENFGKSRKNGNGDEFIVSKKINSNGLVKCNKAFQNNKLEYQSLSKDNDGARENRNPSADIDLCSERISERGTTLRNFGVGPAKEVEESSLNEGSLWKLEQKFSQEAGPMSSPINKSSSDNDGTSPRGYIQRKDKDTKQKSMQTKGQAEIAYLVSLESNLDYVASTAKSPARGDKGNGFVSVRKKKNCAEANGENSMKIPRDVSMKCCLKGKEAAVKRKALADASNLQQTDAHIVTGKWKCPQKSKPNLGPPMKQLRLEQWIRPV